MKKSTIIFEFVDYVRIRENTISKSERSGRKVIIVDEKTIVVEGVGRATDVGELDIDKFIDVAMSLPSFGNTRHILKLTSVFFLCFNNVY